MLFATLDTSVRRLRFDDNKEILLSDTVGFVSKLPHQLVKAFRTTLAEAANADLLVQVVDLSDDHYQEMIETTEKLWPRSEWLISRCFMFSTKPINLLSATLA